MHVEQNVLAFPVLFVGSQNLCESRVRVVFGAGRLRASRTYLFARSGSGSDGLRVRAGTCLAAPQCDGGSMWY